MAVVAPFRALRYNQDKVSSLSNVVTGPYDVINAAQQEAFYQADPYNVIRLELNKTTEADDSKNNIYTRAAAELRRYVADGALRRDQRPAFYASETTYVDADGQTKTRKGYLTLLRVEDFSTGVVLPHELTFTGHREDRLKLTKAAGANISPIFALFPDEQNQVWALMERTRRQEPLMDFVDHAGLPQKLFAVEDPDACQEVMRLMADKVIFIADGHHRYETALNYRNYMRELHPERGEAAAFNYAMVYLCSMSDPGLTVFPCHRMLPHLDGFDARDFLVLAKRFFNVQEIAIAGDPARARAQLAQALFKSGLKRPSFGLASTDSDSYYVLSLKVGVRRTGPMQSTEPALKDLDVIVLSEVLLDHILGLDNAACDQLHTIKYMSMMNEALDEVASGQARVVFLVNPTKVSQVEAVATQRLVMPRKSTYFYPKVLTGLTINLIDPAEDAPTCQG